MKIVTQVCYLQECSRTMMSDSTCLCMTGPNALYDEITKSDLDSDCKINSRVKVGEFV